MGIKKDIKKIEAFRNNFDFIINNEKNCQIISKLTNGLVSADALAEMSVCFQGVEIVSQVKSLENVYSTELEKSEELWNKLQKGFIDYAYEKYIQDVGENKLSKDEYLEKVVDAIEKCPHDKIVQTPLWNKLYHIASTEKTEYRNQKIMEKFQKKAKIEDMYERYKKANEKFENQRSLKTWDKYKFYTKYNGDVKKLDHEIELYEKSTEYTSAIIKIRKYKEELEKKSELYQKAKADYETANKEYDNVLATVYKKNQQYFREVHNIYGHYSLKEKCEKYPEKEAGLENARKLKEEIDSIHPEFLSVLEKLSLIEKTTEDKKKESDLLAKEAIKTKESLIEKYQSQVWKKEETELKELEKKYKKERKKLKDETAKNALEKDFLNAKTNIINSGKQSVDEYAKNGVKAEPALQEIQGKYKTVTEEITAISFAEKQLKSVFEKFDQKLIEYYKALEKVDLVPNDAALSPNELENPRKRDALRTKVLSIDLDKVYEKMKPIHDAREAIKSAKEKVEKLEAEKNKLAKEGSMISYPKEAYDKVEKLKQKRNLQKEAHIYKEALDEFTKIEEELVSNDYTMQKSDLINDIKKRAEEFWAKKDLRIGWHINSKEYNKMMESVDKLRNVDPEDEKKLKEVLEEVKKNTKEYLKAKSLQNRKNPSALRNTRLGVAADLMIFTEVCLENIKKVNYIMGRTELMDKIKYLEECQKNPRMVKELAHKENVNKVKMAEVNAPNKSAEPAGPFI